MHIPNRYAPWKLTNVAENPVLQAPFFLVEVTLRPTVSLPVRLGVLPLLEQVTRCHIYLSDNYFIFFM
jgi:hypothetical protein